MYEQEEKPSKKQAISEDEVTKLAAIVNAAVTAAMKESGESTQNMAKTIAEALIEARKPYIDPKQVAFNAVAKKSAREQAEKQKKVKEFEQSACEHVKGSNPNSFRSDPYDSSIARHVLDTKEVIGICTNCNRVFSSLSPEDVPFLRKKSSNQTSHAGAADRFFENPREAQEARLGKNQTEIFVDEDGNILDYDPSLVESK